MEFSAFQLSVGLKAVGLLSNWGWGSYGLMHRGVMVMWVGHL